MTRQPPTRSGMNPRMGLRDIRPLAPATEPLGPNPEAMRENVRASALARGTRLIRAGQLTSLPPDLPARTLPAGKGGRDRSREAERSASERVAARKDERGRLANHTMRQPCLRCGTRADLHQEFGCGRWAW